MFTWKTRPAPCPSLPPPPALLPNEVDAVLDVALGEELAAAAEALGPEASQ